MYNVIRDGDDSLFAKVVRSKRCPVCLAICFFPPFACDICDCWTMNPSSLPQGEGWAREQMQMPGHATPGMLSLSTENSEDLDVSLAFPGDFLDISFTFHSATTQS